MTDAPSVEPWRIGWSGWRNAHVGHRESVLALSNGHLGWRGTLDEGDPSHTGGAYLNGVFEHHPMPYAEEGYGYPDHGETAVEIPDGKVIRLIVGDDPFDIARGRLVRHDQHLDLRAGTLDREVEWVSPAGPVVRIRSTRVVSLSHRSMGAIAYQVTAVDDAVDVTVLSEILANEPPPRLHPDEQVMEALTTPFEPVGRYVVGDRATLLHRTRHSRVGVAVSMEHIVECDRPTVTATTVEADLARTTVTTRLQPGDSIKIVKYVGHEWSSTIAETNLRDRAEAAVSNAVEAGWDTILADQQKFLDDYWACADVRIEGSPRTQQAVRFALFHLIQAGARVEARSIPGKGLTGPGYEGHTFWDADAFAVPVLSHLAPGVAEQALRWRHATLAHARTRARHLHLAGAAFAWRTIDGPECSGYWPASTAAFHVNAAIAAAVEHHVRVTGDLTFESEIGLELLVETARLWPALGRWDHRGVFHIDGVTGPDEYSALTDDNLYTNLMAQKNLRAAASAARRHPERARELAVTEPEIAEWEAAARSVAVPFDAERNVHQQSAGSTELARWDFTATPADAYPLQEHFPYFDLYRKQVVKQADLVLALHFAPDAFSSSERARAFSYYEALTVRDSSLSASAQAVIAAHVGHLELAWDYLQEAALIDVLDLRGDVEDGLHIAALAGVWTALTSGFGGVRIAGDGRAELSPRLSPPMTRLEFAMRLPDGMLHVDIHSDHTSYSWNGDAPASITHFGDMIHLTPGVRVESPTPPLDAVGRPPTQPPGRSPRDVLEKAGVTGSA